jgi:uncharacterized membrane protein
MSTRRLEAFTDGVFAIAATLLILDVHERGGGSLGHQLGHAWPSYLAYAVSFVSIAIAWANHHTMLELVRGADRTFLLLHGIFLMLIAFIPFPTRLIAEHVRGPGLGAAAIAYGITLTATAVLFNAIWFYAAHGRRLLREDCDPRTVSGITRSYLPGPWIYLGTTLLALWSPVASVLLFAAITLFWAFESSLFGRSG